MTVKRPTRQTCPSARPMNRTLRKVAFTGSTVRSRARQTRANKTGSVRAYRERAETPRPKVSREEVFRWQEEFFTLL
jgi:hypothetical protein